MHIPHLALAALLTLAACAPAGPVPSLAPRPIEKLAGAPEATPPPPTERPAADAALAARIAALVAAAREGEAEFNRIERTEGRALAAARGAPEGSDRWIAGETGRSALEAARQASANALASLDALIIERIDNGAGIDELAAAHADVAAIVARQTDRLSALRR